MTKRADITELQAQTAQLEKDKESLSKRVAQLESESRYNRNRGRTFTITLRTKDGFTKTQAISESEMRERILIPSVASCHYCSQPCFSPSRSCDCNVRCHTREFRLRRQTSETEFLFEEV